MGLRKFLEKFGLYSCTLGLVLTLGTAAPLTAEQEKAMTENSGIENTSKQSVSSHFIGTPVSPETQKVLLKLARQAITCALKEGRTAPLPELIGELALERGAFVTLTINGNLRGCIGRIVGDTALGRIVPQYAVLSALEDHRFRPLSIDELDRVNISISVLSPMKEVAGAEDFIPGIHGILIQKNGRQAIFLPQVAPEQGWNREQTLSHLCMKAGLHQNAWKEPDCKFFVHTAQVFSED